MPSGTVPRIPPQLPPLPPQPSLASPSDWRLHYPPQEVNIPPSSWSPASASASLKRSNTSPRRLPDPFQHQPVAGDRSRSGHSPSSSGSGSSSGHRSHSHSRSGGSRVPLPVLPSASSPEPVVILPPTRVHSRSISTGSTVKPPPTSRPTKDAQGLPSTPRPPPAIKDVGYPLPKPPKHAPPPPLPNLDRALAQEHSLPVPPPKSTSTTTDGSPTQTRPTTPAAPQSATLPAKRYNSSPQLRRAVAAVAVPSPVASTLLTPLSAPVNRPDKEKYRDRERVIMEMPKEKPHRTATNPDQESFIDLDLDGVGLDEPASAPVFPRKRLPSAPTARSATIPLPSGGVVIWPPTVPSSRVRTTSDHAHAPSSRPSDARVVAGLGAVPPSAFAPVAVARTRTVEVAVTVRPPPGLTLGSSPAPSPPPKRPTDVAGYARKWVLEKKGKRLTQDSMVVAQQLRMLR